VPFEALARIYPGEYGAEGEIEIRQLFEPERSDTSKLATTQIVPER
jgi:hypothetical protein